MKFLKFLIIVVVVVGAGYGIWFTVGAKNCPDSDNDGLNDCNELGLYHTEMYNPDTDGDGFSDGEEVSTGHSPHYGDALKLEDVDSDRDGLFDSEEIELGTSIIKKDTDGDGINDFLEVHEGTDPLQHKDEETESGFDRIKRELNL